MERATMTLQELRNAASKLSVSDRLALVQAIINSLQNELRPRPPVPEGTLTGLRGLLKTEEPAPTDAEVTTILEDVLAEKYL
jgi:integrase